MVSLLEKIIVGFVIVGGMILVILYALYMLITALKAWVEANQTWAAVLTLLAIFLGLAVFLRVIRWIEEK